MTRIPLTTSYLPTLIDVRKDLVNAVNRIYDYETLCVRMELGTENTQEKQTGAFHTICARVLSAANRLDLLPEERSQLVRKLETLKIENEGLRGTNTRQREQITHLEAALVRLTAERAA